MESSVLKNKCDVLQNFVVNERWAVRKKDQETWLQVSFLVQMGGWQCPSHTSRLNYVGRS